MAARRQQVDVAAKTDGFAQIMPAAGQMLPPLRPWRPLGYAAPRVGGPVRKQPALKPRLFETRKCLLDAATTSCTMLSAEQLDTQANDALLAATARSTVLDYAEQRRMMKQKADQRLPKLDQGVGETVQRYLWRTRLHECWR
mmetsp:Transcript_62843/g.147473  ORF Transcript_62843/g.147473 Transcript_62843/m.147473 type:complete len:142 (+) Transcript_62843:70-495(+)